MRELSSVMKDFFTDTDIKVIVLITDSDDLQLIIKSWRVYVPEIPL